MTEPVRSRDHTEIALREFGAEVARGAPEDHASPAGPSSTARELVVPSDLSSAAFFIVAALLVPGSRAGHPRRGPEPHALGAARFPDRAWARSIRIPNLESRNGELVGDIVVEHSALRGGAIEGALTAALIDEIPVLAVLGAATEEGPHGAGRRRTAHQGDRPHPHRGRQPAPHGRRRPRNCPTAWSIPGRQKFRAAEFDSFGDHRIAMAFAVAALRADGESVIHGAEAASVSFPEFWETLARCAYSRA